MATEEEMFVEMEEPQVFIERNGVYYQVPEWVRKDVELIKLIDYALTHSTQVEFELPDGSKHACGMGYVEDFIRTIKEAMGHEGERR